MSRPSVLHQGFFVPNAQDVAKPELAEPDRIDFNTVAHTRWGVLSGCLVTVSGTTATNTPGTALVNGKLVQVAGGQNVSVGAGGAQDRFDIVGVDDTGILVGVPGSASADPVFPDVPLNTTTLAAVLCTAGGGSYTDNVVDKRKFLADSLLTKIPPEQDLLVNRNGSGNLFGVDGSGKTVWNGDTTLQREDIGVLRVISHLRIDETLVTGGGITAKSLTATEKITGSNLRSSGTLPGTGNIGDLFSNSSDGSVYVYKQGAWKEIATIESAIPMGSIITSLRPPTNMPAGWVPLDGAAQVYQSTQGPLFALLDSWGWPRSGVAPNQVITTRSANKRVLMVDFDTPGSHGGSNDVTIALANMPTHIHNAKAQASGGITPVARVGRAPGHRHTVYGGAHPHDIIDDGHAHHGADNYLGGGFIVAQLYGQNKIDALFNDRSHTYSVEMTEWTRSAQSNVRVSTGGSEHQHEVTDSGDHDHQVTIDALPNHPHAILEDPQGLGASMRIVPAHLTVYCYIKA